METIKESGIIAAETIKAIVNRNNDTLAKIAEFVLSDAPEHVQYYFFDTLLNIDNDFKKEGADDDGSKNHWLTGAAAAMLGAAPIAYMAAKHHSKKNKSNDMLRQVLLEEPELRDNPETTKRYLDVITQYSPSLLESPDAVKNTLREWHRMGGRSIQPEMITKLLEIEEKKVKGTHPIISEGAKGLGAGALMAAIPALVSAFSSKKSDKPSGGFYI